jgi:hypothetical protein
VRLTFNRLLNLIGNLGWGVVFIPPIAFSWIKKDGDLVGIIHVSKVAMQNLLKLHGKFEIRV